MNNRAKELEDRLVKFSKEIIDLCEDMKRTEISTSIISQLVRSATSIGANYCEANNASSRKDFKNKIYICKKESQETKYWLRLIKKLINDKTKAEILLDECHQFNLIFQKIVSTMENAK